MDEKASTDSDQLTPPCSEPLKQAADQKIIGVDRGWAWFTVVGNCIVHIVIAGIERSGGIVFLYLSKIFPHASAFYIAWIFSLYKTIRLVGAPIASIMLRRVTARSLVMGGAILHVVGIFLAAFPFSIPYLYVTFGAIAGFGCSLMYTPSMTVVSWYFDKYRSIATGISTAGAGIGTFIGPLLVTYLFDEYGYLGTMLVCAAFVSHACISAALYRPLEVHKRIHSARDGFQGDKKGAATESGSKSESSCVSERHKCDRESPIDFDDKKSDKIRVESEAVGGNSNFRRVPISRHLRRCASRCTSQIISYSGLRLFKDYVFLVCTAASVLSCLGILPFLMFLPTLGISNGLSPWQVSLALSLTGASDAIFRIVAGIIGDIRFLRPYRPYIYNSYFFGQSISALSSVFASTFGEFLVATMAFGAFTGMYLSQRSVVMVDYMGLVNLADSLAMTLLFQAVAAIIGPPISDIVLGLVSPFVHGIVIAAGEGALLDIFGRCDEVFYLIAAVYLVGGLVLASGNVVYYRRRVKSSSRQTEPMISH